MTMLDRMRRHKGWLKWSLALVVLTFVVFYIPDFLTTSTGAAPSEVLADVEGEPITVGAFTRRYNAQVQAYRNAYGGQINDQLLKQLGIDRQILQQLVDEEAMVAESRKQGITVSDVEIRERILALPGFQENGKFVGEQRYRQILQFQNPPLTTAEFENSLRRALQIEKLRTALTGWMSVSDADVAAEFRKRNEKVKLDVVPVTADAFKSQVTVTDAELAAVLREDEGQATASARSARSSTRCSTSTRCAQTITVPEAEIAAFYQQNLSQYQTPAQVRASHILFKTEGKDENAVQGAGRRRAEEGQGARRRLRRARQAVLGRRDQQRQRRRPRLLRPRPHGAGVRAGRVRDEDRRDQRPGEDRVRLPHHQDGRQQARDDAAAGRGARRDRGSAEVAEGAGRSRADRQVARSRPSRRRPTSTASRRSAACTVVETGLFLRRRADRRASGPQPELSRPRVRA